jgi:hypothetical protein
MARLKMCIRLSDVVCDLNTASCNALGAVLNISLEETAPSALQTLNKRLRNNISADGQSVSVVARNEVSIGLRLAQRLPSSGSICTVVNVESVRAKSGSDALAVVNKAATAVSECPRFPGIVGCRAADNDLGALCDDRFAGLDQVEWIRVDSRSCAIVG